MKPAFPLTLFLSLTLSVPGFLLLAAEDVGPGDDRHSVIETLGDPNGRIGSDRFEILHFPRGEVVLRDGVVERADLISPEELTARMEREEARRIARKREHEERIARGEALRDEKLADESFQQRSPRERLAYWQAFGRHYPEVDISFELDVLRQKVEEAERIRREEERREERLLAMEQRIRQAERRAEKAEEEARRLEEQRRQRQYTRHIHSTYIIQPEQKKPDDSEQKAPSTPQPREHRIHGEPERQPTAFERAREYRHERSRQRNEARYSSN